MQGNYQKRHFWGRTYIFQKSYILFLPKYFYSKIFGWNGGLFDVRLIFCCSILKNARKMYYIQSCEYVLSLSLTILNLVWFSRSLLWDICSYLQTAVVRVQPSINLYDTCNMFLWSLCFKFSLFQSVFVNYRACTRCS